MKKVEIEQKFIYKYIPFEELKLCNKTVIFRKYICGEPEIRINKRVFESGETRCNLTIKTGDFLLRTEIKLRLTDEEYQQISDTILCDDIVMDIYEFKIDINHTMSFKKGRNASINFAEIEYTSQEDYEIFSKTVKKLPFLEKEVTWDSQFYMRNIWEKFYVEFRRK